MPDPRVSGKEAGYLAARLKARSSLQAWKEKRQHMNSASTTLTSNTISLYDLYAGTAQWNLTADTVSQTITIGGSETIGIVMPETTTTGTWHVTFGDPGDEVPYGYHYDEPAERKPGWFDEDFPVTVKPFEPFGPRGE